MLSVPSQLDTVWENPRERKNTSHIPCLLEPDNSPLRLMFLFWKSPTLYAPFKNASIPCKGETLSLLHIISMNLLVGICDNAGLSTS